MQKKDYSSGEQPSNWQDNIKKEQRSDMLKKIAIWGVIILAIVVGLGGLVYLADKSSTSNSAPVEVANLPPVSKNDLVVGNPDAKVIITEYADYQCPACAGINPALNAVLKEYADKVKVVYRFFPLRGIHKNAIISGQAAYAAYQMGRFPEMKDRLYEKQAEWENLDDPRKTFVGYAEFIGLDTAEFERQMNRDEAKKAVEAGESEALSLGLNSTPTFFIGNKRFQPAGFDDFKKLIEEEINTSN